MSNLTHGSVLADISKKNATPKATGYFRCEILRAEISVETCARNKRTANKGSACSRCTFKPESTISVEDMTARVSCVTTESLLAKDRARAEVRKDKAYYYGRK